ncbi:MAG TPA: hypothetical protein PLL75_03605 [Candidatus Omnitrophota bacterium]|nr:hypothetical protein [Candidatus Omnitrophota bacterium]HPS36794.1 hypothetical protein [Candidatus Omnitrophota bacterium]
MTDLLKDLPALLKEIPFRQLSFLIWPLGIMAAVFGGSFIYQRAKIQKLATALGAQVSSGNKGCGIWEGAAYEFSYKSGSRHESAHLELRIRHVFPGEFSVSKENKIDQFFQNLRISREIKAGDAAFDEKFYIETNVEEATQQYFSQETKRVAVERLFNAGVTRIEHTGKQLVLFKYPFPKDGAEVAEILKSAKDLLENAAYTAAGGGTGLLGLQALKKGFSAGAAGLFFLGFLAFLFAQTQPVFNEQGLFFFSLRYSIPPLGCLWAAVVFFFKGRSFFHRLFISVFFSSVIGGVLLGSAAVKILNVWRDHGPSAYRQAPVLDRRKEGKHHDVPYLYVQAWKAARAIERVKVSAKVFDEAVPKRTIALLETKPGRFGFEWLVRGRIVTCEQFDAMADEARKKARINPAYYL